MTAKIELHDVNVVFPIFGASSRSLRNAVIKRVGGSLSVSKMDDLIHIQALKNISLQINDGDRVGLIGHNGAGKSTLLRVFGGAYEPSSGVAVVKGRVGSLLDIMMGMDPEFTGQENIIIRSLIAGIPLDEAKDKIPEIIEFTDLGEFI